MSDMYNFSIKQTREVPMSVTQAVAAIQKLVMFESQPFSAKVIGSDTKKMILPVTKAVMLNILGEDIAIRYPYAMMDKALEQYMSRVLERLCTISTEYSIVLAYSDFCWFICCLPRTADEMISREMLYSTADLTKHDILKLSRLPALS